MNEDSSEIKEDKNASKEQTAALNSAKTTQMECICLKMNL